MDSPDFVRDFAVVVTGAAVSLIVFRRLKLPTVLGFLLAGALLGPYSFMASPVRDVETIRLLADVGLVMLLFALGVDLGWEKIRSVGTGVILTALFQFCFMVGLGYLVGTLLGWTSIESLFLGAAIAVTSSAVAVQFLRDRGQLTSYRGRTVIGISVVEDMAAVVLLSVLAGMASSGGDAAAGDGEGLGVIWRLLIFAAAALVFGALLAPRVLDLLARFRSNQIMLMGSLGICFGLALAASELGLSAGAGAFFIGMVIGDTKHSHSIARMTEPVRDLFAALFYVSIGMLVSFADIGRFIVPVVLVTLAIIVGKVFANSLGIYLAKRDTKSALEVGTAMPQPGELSLAVVKTGTDHGAVGAAISPVVTASILLTSLLYPVIFASAGLLERLIDRKAPVLMRKPVTSVSESMAAAQQLMRTEGETSQRIKQQLSIAVINLAIIGLIVVAGVTVLRFTEPLAQGINVPVSIVGLVLGGVLVTLSVPPGLTVWKSLARVAEDVTNYLLLRRINVKRDSFAGSLASLTEHTALALGMFALAVWMTPLLMELVSVGDLATPLAVLTMIGTMALTARIAVTIHTSLETTVERTFLGVSEQPVEGDLDAIAHLPEPGSAELNPSTHRNGPVL